jgi:hypothetical protein
MPFFSSGSFKQTQHLINSQAERTQAFDSGSSGTALTVGFEIQSIPKRSQLQLSNTQTVNFAVQAALKQTVIQFKQPLSSQFGSSVCT